MGALSRPGPQLGAAPPPMPEVQAGPGQSFLPWFWRFLKTELTPYPGRMQIVVRMVVAATITMWLIMTFRLPGAAIAAFYTLLLSRDSPVTTLRSAWVVLVSYVVGAIYSILGVMLFVDYPITHLLWVVASIFLCFYVIKVTTNYVAAAAFAFIITIVIPVWDSSLPTELLLVATLWAAGSVTVGLATTIAVEYGFAFFVTSDELLLGLVRRLRLVGAFLEQRAHKQVDPETRKHMEELAMVGVSRLRRLAAQTSPQLSDTIRRSGSISLVGRLIELSASLLELDYTYNEEEIERIRAVRRRLDAIADTLAGGTSQPLEPTSERSPQPPILFELERTTDLLALNLAHSSETEADAPKDEFFAPPAPKLFVPDALTNAEHLHYALRGCLAGSFCYILFNAIQWRGLSTSIATCVITGLSSIGSSRQKQLLRISGAIVGGLVLGVGAQVFILPTLDTLSGFTVLFVVVTFVSAWVATASPRLSYMGLQIALAFYLINLQEFGPQTNLAIARDRVMGVGLGLVAMALVFDVLGSKPAVAVMCEIFAANLRLLAELAQPWKDEQPADHKRLRALRDKISANFASVNAQGDAVLFEVGPSRRRDLPVRERLLDWQPRLRSIFFIELSLLQYRTQLGPDELPQAIRDAQLAFDEQVASTMQELASRFSREPAQQGTGDEQQAGARLQESDALGSSYRALERAIHEHYAAEPQSATPRAQAILLLASNLSQVLAGLTREMREHKGQDGTTNGAVFA